MQSRLPCKREQDSAGQPRLPCLGEPDCAGQCWTVPDCAGQCRTVLDSAGQCRTVLDGLTSLSLSISSWKLASPISACTHVWHTCAHMHVHTRTQVHTPRSYSLGPCCTLTMRMPSSCARFTGHKAQRPPQHSLAALALSTQALGGGPGIHAQVLSIRSTALGHNSADTSMHSSVAPDALEGWGRLGFGQRSSGPKHLTSEVSTDALYNGARVCVLHLYVPAYGFARVCACVRMLVCRFSWMRAACAVCTHKCALRICRELGTWVRAGVGVAVAAGVAVGMCVCVCCACWRTLPDGSPSGMPEERGGYACGAWALVQPWRGYA